MGVIAAALELARGDLSCAGHRYFDGALMNPDVPAPVPLPHRSLSFAPHPKAVPVDYREHVEPYQSWPGWSMGRWSDGTEFVLYFRGSLPTFDPHALPSFPDFGGFRLREAATASREPLAGLLAARAARLAEMPGDAPVVRLEPFYRLLEQSAAAVGYLVTGDPGEASDVLHDLSGDLTVGPDPDPASATVLRAVDQAIGAAIGG